MALIRCPDCRSDVSDIAPACPKCGRPIALASSPEPEALRATKIAVANRQTSIRGAIALSVFATIGLLAWLGNDRAASVDGDTASAQSVSQASIPSPEIETTPDQLQSAYDTNEVAADNIFKGKTVRIKGTIASIDKDFTDDVVLRLAARNQFMDVSATMIDSEKAAAADLRKGQPVTVDCESVMRIVGSPSASKCRFAPEG